MDYKLFILLVVIVACHDLIFWLMKCIFYRVKGIMSYLINKPRN